MPRRPPPQNFPTLSPEPAEASRFLLSLDEPTASALFRSLTLETQLSIIRATPNPRAREALYYLVPDCTDLVRASPVEGILEIINTVFGTGLACGILSAVSAEQFAEMFQRTAFRNEVLDPEIVEMWVAELAELDPDELTELLAHLDVELVAELFRGRVEVPTPYKGMVLASGVLELEQVEFKDENGRLMGELLWATDPEFFIAVLRVLLAQEEEAGSAEEELDSEESPEPDAEEDLDLARLDELLPHARRAQT